MADPTSYSDLAELTPASLGSPAHPIVYTNAEVSATGTSILITEPGFVDDSGTVLATPLMASIRYVGGDYDAYTERVKVTAISADKKTLTVKRGMPRSGKSVDTADADSSRAKVIPKGSIVEIAPTPQQQKGIDEVLSGTLPTGANSFQIGDGTATEQLFKANQGLANDSAIGFDASGDPIIYLADGSSFVPGAGVGAISGGDGIDVTASVISADLATDPGLEMSSNKLRVKVKTSGGITRDGDGLSVKTSDFLATLLSDTAYSESTWNGVTNVAPSKNAVRDEVESIKTTFSKILAINTTPVTVSGTTTQTTLFSTTIPGNTLGTNRAIRVKYYITELDLGNSGGDTCSLYLKYGSTISASYSYTYGTTGTTNLSGYFEGILVSAGTTGSQKAFINSVVQYGASSYSLSGADATGTDDSTAEKTLSVTVAFSDSVGSTISVDGYVCELI